MTFDIAPAFARAQSVVNGLIAAVPSVGLALIVFGLFFLAAKGVKTLVARLSISRPQERRHGRLRVRWWIAPPKQADALDARDQVLTAIRAALSNHGIDLPFPTQQILFHDQTEESDGDRALQRRGVAFKSG